MDNSCILLDRTLSIPDNPIKITIVKLLTVKHIGNSKWNKGARLVSIINFIKINDELTTNIHLLMLIALLIQIR